MDQKDTFALFYHDMVRWLKCALFVMLKISLSIWSSVVSTGYHDSLLMVRCQFGFLSTGGRLSMEYLKVEQHEGIAVVNFTTDKTLSKLTHQQIQGETGSQENGQSGSLRLRRMKPKSQSKRQIPGGPDPQHH